MKLGLKAARKILVEIALEAIRAGVVPVSTEAIQAMRELGWNETAEMAERRLVANSSSAK